MNNELAILLSSSALVAFIHTLFGPDHYLPFVALSQANRWTKKKTMFITAFCGFGHTLSSMFIAGIGIGAGIGLTQFEWIKSVRGDIAAWFLIGFGLLYTLWGLREVYFNPKPHHHSVGTTVSKNSIWALFIFFVLGPCEPLIPLLMASTFQHSYVGLFAVSLVFTLVTISTMMGFVYLGITGLGYVQIRKFEPYTHAFAGSIILSSGLGIQFLGL
ncbi:MAG: hypothetical protein HOA15_03675 [Candidatus Marinimicrobia bacterium]|jgi:sulfite exporter TauE/SafE|nr:hypothetical protein [Candidatus Neomarinimicrobiota bacterium]MBT3675059.1 hypothetical protein [Candidatus Neomarinimicrobiota bacterium]MBT3763632.1 hypothetical protein [Candidatus Neomarinimicrobiota bacterium]MBT4068836.1 hypothetical protein [Candidatus Neomarinimicrobiota bacterium]MBT4271284.1 hypothetical protein [Candidatus Neomarinimicrobiota bacterium]